MDDPRHPATQLVPDDGQSPVGQRRRLKAERPGQILEAAFEEFAQKGFADARLEDVARRIGVTKGTIYLYFNSKVDLFKAMVLSTAQPIFDQVEGVVASYDGSPTELLRSLLLGAYEDMLGDPRKRQIMRLLIAEGEKFPELVEFYHDEVMARGVALLKRVVDAGVMAGEFRASALTEMPLPLFSPVIHACVMGLLFGSRRPLDVEAFKQAHIELVLGNLRAPEGPALPHEQPGASPNER